MNENVRVLIVEDREDHQKIFLEIVNSLTYHATIVSNLSDALETLNCMTFHVALVDLRLVDEEKENWDGFKVLEHLKKLDEGTKVIVLTAFGEVEEASDAFRNYNVYHFIRKAKMDVLEVGRQIQKAAEEAKNEMIRPSKSALSMLTILGKDVETLAEAIFGNTSDQNTVSNLRNTEELDSFLRQAIHDYHPVFPAIQGRLKEHILGNGHISFRLKLWSKAIGAPIEIWFGKRDDIKEEIINTNQSEEEQTKLGYIKKLADLSEAVGSQYFGGVIYTLGNIHSDKFLINKK